MGLVLETRGDAKVPATAPQTPKQVRMFVRTGAQHFAIGGHHLERQHVVDGKAMFPHQPADTTTEREARNAGLGHDARWHREAVDMGLAVEFAQENTGLSSNAAP